MHDQVRALRRALELQRLVADTELDVVGPAIEGPLDVFLTESFQAAEGEGLARPQSVGLTRRKGAAPGPNAHLDQNFIGLERGRFDRQGDAVGEPDLGCAEVMQGVAAHHPTRLEAEFHVRPGDLRRDGGGRHGLAHRLTERVREGLFTAFDRSRRIHLQERAGAGQKTCGGPVDRLHGQTGDGAVEQAERTGRRVEDAVVIDRLCEIIGQIRRLARRRPGHSVREGRARVDNLPVEFIRQDAVLSHSPDFPDQSG